LASVLILTPDFELKHPLLGCRLVERHHPELEIADVAGALIDEYEVSADLLGDSQATQATVQP
jgi:hypothetical protein